MDTVCKKNSRDLLKVIEDPWYWCMLVKRCGWTNENTMTRHKKTLYKKEDTNKLSNKTHHPSPKKRR